MRDELLKRHRTLFDEVSAILFELDPIGINYEQNTDEYDPEVGTILPRLETCPTVESVRAVVHQEFVRWFGPEAGDEALKLTRRLMVLSFGKSRNSR